MLGIHLKEIIKNHKIDLVVANVENASGGFGITRKNLKELEKYGVNVMTSGNHIWDKREILDFIDEEENLLRPLNYSDKLPGKGTTISEIDGEKIAIINLMGVFTMPYTNNPFVMIEEEIKILKEKNIKNIFIDFHAEATAEKRSLMMFLQGKVSAIFGTHTHIGTDDLEITNNTAYVSDVGLTGCHDKVIGMDEVAPIERMLSGISSKFEVNKKCKKIIQGIVFDINDGKTTKAFKIKAFDEGVVSESMMVENQSF